MEQNSVIMSVMSMVMRLARSRGKSSLRKLSLS